MSNWQDIFEPKRGTGMPPLPSAEPVSVDDVDLSFDLDVYRPWIIQRGRSRPPMMLELRRYEPRSGLWSGWQLSYPHLVAIEYVGDRMLSMDFGTRHFVIEGQGLRELARQTQCGAVLAIQEYASAVWPNRPSNPIVTAIRRVTGDAQPR